jgi:hypothetical protein
MDPVRDQYREFVARWQKAGPAVEQVCRQELRNFRHADPATSIDALLAVGLMHCQPNDSSGIIEMQRILRKARP